MPERHGMSEVVSQISEYIVKQGHEVVVATKFDKNRHSDVINGVQIKSFKISGNSVNGIEGDTESYLDFVQNGDFDVITNFAAQQWATDLCLPILDKLKAYKVFVPTGFSNLHNPNYNQYFQRMRKWIHAYDMNIFLSNTYQDVNFARENGVEKIAIIPNGASLNEFTKTIHSNLREDLGIDNEKKIIVHVGSYTGLKGHDEALSIFLKSKHENAIILFLGQNFNESRSIRFMSKLNFFKLCLNRRIFYPHYVINALMFAWKRMKTSKGDKIYWMSVPRETLVDYFVQADILLLPSMIECSPVVLFEALASKTPFLVTKVGNSAEIIEWTNGGELLHTSINKKGYSIVDVDKAAIQLDDLLKNDNKLQKLAENGFKNWREKFTWEVISEQYLNLYKRSQS